MTYGFIKSITNLMLVRTHFSKSTSANTIAAFLPPSYKK